MRNFDPPCERNGVVGIRRLEVITGAGGRRMWSAEDKARIVAESLASGANVSAIARRYGLRPQQVYTWRRLARAGEIALPADGDIEFVPVVAAAEAPAPVPASGGAVEIAVAGTLVRVAPGVDWRFLRDVLRAAKAAP
jgi:transposase